MHGFLVTYSILSDTPVMFEEYVAPLGMMQGLCCAHGTDLQEQYVCLLTP